MRVRLKTSPRSGAPATERVLDAPVIRIGRGTDQTLVLADLRVALAHAELSPSTSRPSGVRLEAKTRLGVYVNGSPQLSAELSPGDVLDFGRFRLTVGKPTPGEDLSLTLTERYAEHDETAVRKVQLRTRLSQVAWSRRSMAWVLFGLILIGGLIVPAVTHLHAIERTQTVSRDRIPPDKSAADLIWNSGPLSAAHHALTTDCAACHRKPFEAVRDDTCRGCHTALKEHASDHARLAAPPFAGWRCTDCHREHNGPALIPAANRICTDCHRDPQQTAHGTLEAVPDWSRHHPPFRLQLSRRNPTETGFHWIEARQGTPEALHEDTGLKYPHDVHLDPQGIDAPGGKRVLVCADCHTPTADGTSFQPIAMATHCAACHRLDFDPAAPDRELPHGKPAEVVQVVRDYYARVALAGGAPWPDAPAVVRQVRRPGETLPPAQARAALAWADARAAIALRDVFERRTCFYCHTVTGDGSAEHPWTIAAVAPNRPAYTRTVFPHDQHRTVPCTSCHAVETSQHAQDVVLPDIQRCRDCHGDTGALKETPSTCQSCHDYHAVDWERVDSRTLPPAAQSTARGMP